MTFCKILFLPSKMHLQTEKVDYFLNKWNLEKVCLKKSLLNELGRNVYIFLKITKYINSSANEKCHVVWKAEHVDVGGNFVRQQKAFLCIVGTFMQSISSQRGNDLPLWNILHIFLRSWGQQPLCGTINSQQYKWMRVFKNKQTKK